MNTFKLVHMGARYERAFQAKDYGKLGAIEREIQQLQEKSDDWLAPWFVRGRNFVRVRRGLEQVRA